MATGIVSVACQLLELRLPAQALFFLNGLLFYPALWILSALRLIRHPRAFAADFGDHRRGVGFFTWVAGTCVLGTQCLLVHPLPRLAFALWVAGVALWLLVTYGVLVALTVKRSKPSLAEGLDGGWLTAVVAVQSVSILSAELALQQSPASQALLFFALATWLSGGMLYMWLISLILYRWVFVELEPDDLTPSYWINMGAAAISTLAGSLLVVAAPSFPLLLDLRPFLRGLTLLFWSTATWWIPLLVLLGIWRHVVRRFPLRYSPLYWAAVFPLGMYTACSVQLSRALDLPFLMDLPRAFVFVALVAWALAFAGLCRAVLRALTKPEEPPRPNP